MNFERDGRGSVMVGWLWIVLDGEMVKENWRRKLCIIISYRLLIIKEEINILHIPKCVEDCNEIYVIKIWSSLIKVNKIINKKINSSNLKLNY